MTPSDPVCREEKEMISFFLFDIKLFFEKTSLPIHFSSLDCLLEFMGKSRLRGASFRTRFRPLPAKLAEEAEYDDERKYQLKFCRDWELGSCR